MWINAAGVSAQPCESNGVALQALGSNGPRISADRASTGYFDLD
jgi:hypothetical protein